MIERLLALLRSRSLKGELLRGGISGLVIRVLAVLAGLLSSVALARGLGPSEFGVYSFVLAATTSLALPVQLGLPTLIVRETAQAAVLEDWPRMRGVWRWASLVILAGSTAMIVLVGVWLVLFGETMDPARRAAFVWGLPLIPLIAFGRARAAALRGLRRLALGQLPDQVLRPVFHAALIAGAWFGWTQITAAVGLALHGVAALLTFVLGAVFLLRARPEASREEAAVRMEHSTWVRAIIPLSLITGLQTISQNTDLLMLGLFRSDEEVGVYKVAVSVASVTVFGLTVFNMVMQPYIAQLYARKDIAQLKKLVSGGALIGVIVTLPVIAICVFAGKLVLRLAFGEGFEAAHVALVILALGQGVNAFFGSVGNLLTMSGHERENVNGLVKSAIANVILNALLIPTYGIEGAAFASGISTALWNVSFWVSARRCLGIDSTPVYLVLHTLRRSE